MEAQIRDAPITVLRDVFIGFSHFLSSNGPGSLLDCKLYSKARFSPMQSRRKNLFFFFVGKKWDPKNIPEIIARVFKPNCGAQVVWK